MPEAFVLLAWCNDFPVGAAHVRALCDTREEVEEAVKTLVRTEPERYDHMRIWHYDEGGDLHPLVGSIPC